MKLLITLLLMSLTAQADTITVHAGLKTTLRHTYKNSAGVAQTIAGLTIHGTIKKARGGAAVLTLSTDGDDPAIEIIESGSTNVGVFDVTLVSALTSGLAPGYYLLGYSYCEEGETEFKFFGEVGVDIVQPVDVGPTPTATP